MLPIYIYNTWRECSCSGSPPADSHHQSTVLDRNQSGVIVSLASTTCIAGNEKVRYMEFCGEVELKLLTPDLTLGPSYPPCKVGKFSPINLLLVHWEAPSPCPVHHSLIGRMLRVRRWGIPTKRIRTSPPTMPGMVQYFILIANLPSRCPPCCISQQVEMWGFFQQMKTIWI